MLIRILALSLALVSTAAFAGDYCAAIRGNGENVAAHWSALSRMIEEKGMPEKMAGGSSATVSMFFLDNIAGNPAIKEEKNADLKRKKEGLLVKSLGEFVTEMARNEQAMSAYQFMNELAKKDSDMAARLEKLLAAKDKISADELNQAVQKYFPLLNPDMVRGLLKNPRFFAGEAKKAVDVFGKFDAVGDQNLFFRPGLVDFKEFAINLGQIADFYRGNTDEGTKRELEAYLSACAEKTYRKEWSESDDGCKRQFQGIVAKYMRAGQFQNKALFEPIGQNIESIPTTSLIKGNAVKRYSNEKNAYAQGEQRDYGKFSVDFDKELKFGYWTAKNDQIKKGLAPLIQKGDLKSQKFEALKPNNWFEVLATSPAEPGLASIQPIPVNTNRAKVLAEREKPVTERWSGLEYSKEALSAGGWSDLHPGPVLKAAGCQRVAYFSRKDGETIFGQQVFIRLTGAQQAVPFWQKIGEQNNTGWKAEGPVEASPWNRLYNLGNTQSSFNRSLRTMSISYCTDWNRFNPFKGEMPAMQKEAYGAPVFVAAGTDKSFQVNKGASPDAAKFPGCLPAKLAGGDKTGTEEMGVGTAE
jgi:hypothetical protein